MIIYRSGELKIEGFIDSSFQSDIKDFKLISGYVFLLNGVVKSSKSSKQDIIADSTTDIEYIAASEATKEDAWIRNYVQQLGIVLSIADLLVIFYDSITDPLVIINDPNSFEMLPSDSRDS